MKAFRIYQGPHYFNYLKLKKGTIKSFSGICRYRKALTIRVRNFKCTPRMDVTYFDTCVCLHREILCRCLILMVLYAGGRDTSLYVILLCGSKVQKAKYAQSSSRSSIIRNYIALFTNTSASNTPCTDS